jgi:hypothetical protein
VTEIRIRAERRIGCVDLELWVRFAPQSLPAVVPAESVAACQTLAFSGVFLNVGCTQQNEPDLDDFGPFSLVAGGGFEPPTFGL